MCRCVSLRICRSGPCLTLFFVAFASLYCSVILCAFHTSSLAHNSFRGFLCPSHSLPFAFCSQMIHVFCCVQSSPFLVVARGHAAAVSALRTPPLGQGQADHRAAAGRVQPRVDRWYVL